MYPSLNGTPITEQQLAVLMPVLARKENHHVRHESRDTPRAEKRSDAEKIVIRLLAQHGPMTARDMSTVTSEVGYTTLVGYARSLEKQGLIERNAERHPWRLCSDV